VQFDKSYLTEAGRSVATSVVGGLDKVQFTKAVASTHDYSKSTVSDIKQLTELDGILVRQSEYWSRAHYSVHVLNVAYMC